MTLVWLFTFIVSLYILIKAADYFNLSAEKIGLSFNLSPFVIGVLLVAAGTSLPELVTSIASILKGAPEMVAGNVMGSNVANVFFVLGLASVISGKFIHLNFDFSDIDIQYLTGSAVFLIITCYDQSFNRWEGIVGLIAFAAYLTYLNKAPLPENKKPDHASSKAGLKYYIIFALSLVFLVIGGNYAIESVVNMAAIFKIQEELIAATAIAAGTSLPELFVSLDAFKKNKAELAIGNLAGSCIFNAFAVMGIASLFETLPIEGNIVTIGIPFTVFSSLLFFFTIRDKVINRFEGILYLVFYVLFLAKVLEIF
ncbi:calcium/sodium antiporter [Cytophagaceae bacterium ABcell3]|nr:calcium/sodium antiporter [Cytophagaceae bacterium ABcell3]